MPYYIYRVTQTGPIRHLNKIAEFDVFKEASNEAKRLRRETDLAPGEAFKTMFAANELEAEDLLNQPPREDLTTGEDY
ncbi:MAG: hypothetical protein IPH39_12090 [Sulfuritalea sp.]|jgi:hypothetical protein|nr:hypothetical protein [Sulfuritalea sp.]MBK8761077.1 hypothetical protein [Sulfuritalea sp.]MBK9349827.1 hypothetical protein [Sulfuritalea sp.]MBP6636913.1 hypothetical protein [Sulfuritalea sp.]